MLCGKKEKNTIMKKRAANLTPDFQQFIDKFQPNKFKLMAKGIEVRGINNIPKTITQAKDLIDRLELKLIISHDAGMLSYGGFEVNNR